MRTPTLLCSLAVVIASLILSYVNADHKTKPTATCEFHYEYPGDPGEMTQLVFKKDPKTDGLNGIDRPDDPPLSIYRISVLNVNSAKASFNTSVNTTAMPTKSPQGFTMFRMSFYDPAGYAQKFLYKVKNNTPCLTTIVGPANIAGQLVMNVVAWDA